MLLTIQAIVRSRFHLLVMSVIAGGFLVLLTELLIYSHYQQLQLVGLAAVIIGLIASVLGIGARGTMRTRLVAVFLVVSLSGLLGLYFHNERRIGGESGPPQAGGSEPQGGETGSDGPRMPPPVLASLSVTGLCIFGAVMLLARRDEE